MEEQVPHYQLKDPTTFIHQSSQASIHPTAKIGSHCWIGPHVTIGPGVVVRDHVIIEGHCSIGTPAEHRGQEFSRMHQAQRGMVVIEAWCNIREFVTINMPIEPGTWTRVGERCYIMRGCHIGHDCLVGADATLACNVLLGGHTKVGRGATLGLGSITHQRSLIGAYAMLGMGAVVPKQTEILPGRTYVGNPARFLKGNKIGLERAGITGDELDQLMSDYLKEFSRANNPKGQPSYVDHRPGGDHAPDPAGQHWDGRAVE